MFCTDKSLGLCFYVYLPLCLSSSLSFYVSISLFHSLSLYLCVSLMFLSEHRSSCSIKKFRNQQPSFLLSWTGGGNVVFKCVHWRRMFSNPECYFTALWHFLGSSKNSYSAWILLLNIFLSERVCLIRWVARTCTHLIEGWLDRKCISDICPVPVSIVGNVLFTRRSFLGERSSRRSHVLENSWPEWELIRFPWFKGNFWSN